VTAPDEDNLNYALTWVADMTAPPTTPASLASAALFYASMGWPVLPLLPGERAPHGGLVRHGLDQASTDAEQVAAWWKAVPEANIGLRTGVRFDVIDLDVKDGKDGVAAFWSLVEETGLRPRLLGSTLTTTGGRHLLVAATGKGNFVNVRPGVDYRGLSGYIVAPPSVIGSTPYRWVVQPVAEIQGERAA
jgi:hypothetical protein